MEDWSTLQKVRDLLWDCTDQEYADCLLLLRLYRFLGPLGRKWLVKHPVTVMRIVHWVV